MRFNVTVFLLFTGSFLSHAQYTETINSSRPGSSEGGFSVGTEVIQAELGGRLGNDRHHLLDSETDLWGIDYILRYGFWREQLEVSFSGSFLTQTTDYEAGGATNTYSVSNFESNTLGAKYLLYDPYKNASEKAPNIYSWRANRRFDWSQLIPAISVYAGVNFSLGDNPYLYEGEGMISPKVALITQNNWEGGWVFVTNLVANKIGQEFPTYTGIMTLTHSFSPKFAAFGEFQTIMSDLYSDEIIRGGLAYLIHKDLQLDLSGLLNFKNTPSRWQAGLGISYRFDMHSQDEFLAPEN